MDVGMNQFDDVEFTVTKYAAHIPVSDELLWEHGVYIGPERPPIVPTRRAKIQRWTSRKVTALRLRLGSWIAGVDLGDEDP
jgi:hypothetical protein